MSDPTPTSADYVSVPVPSRHVMAVYRYLAELDQPTPDRAPHTPGGTDAEGWTRDEMARLTDVDKPAVRLVCRVVDLLADHPGRQVTFPELREHLGVDRDRLNGALSTLTRIVNNRFPGRGWPMSCVVNGNAAYYSVSQQTADDWRTIRRR